MTDAQGKPVADAVVVAVPVDGSMRLPTKPHDNVVDQVDKQFSPKVQAVLVGTPVTFPNNDNVRHQVYSFSPAKRFELPLYAGVPAQPVVFDKPGVVVLGCNIHDWMVGYVYVSESPYFAKTGNDGKALLADLPPRAYVVRVWHPQAGRHRGIDAQDRRRRAGARRRGRLDAEAQAGGGDAARTGARTRRALLKDGTTTGWLQPSATGARRKIHHRRRPALRAVGLVRRWIGDRPGTHMEVRRNPFRDESARERVDVAVAEVGLLRARRSAAAR